MKYGLFFSWLCTVLVATAVAAEAKPAEKLPIFVNYSLQYARTLGSVRYTSMGTVTLQGTLERVKTWSSPTRKRTTTAVR